MPPTFTAMLAEHLAARRQRPVREAVDGEEINAGVIYLAPGGKHMTVTRRDGDRRDRDRRRPAGQFLQACGRSDVCLRRRGLGQQDAGAGADRHGFGRLAGAKAIVAAGGTCHGAGRGDQRGLGHAGSGRQCGLVLGGTAAHRDRAASSRGCSPGSARDARRISTICASCCANVPAWCWRPRSNIWPKAGCCRSRAAHGMTTLDRTGRRLRNRRRQRSALEVVEAMTTNETFFFRDKMPFDHFRDTIMPALLAARAREKRIRIWCTAASTGQEPYSLAMVIKGMGPAVAGYRIDILRPIFRPRFWKRPRPASTASSKCSAGCRCRCW